MCGDHCLGEGAPEDSGTRHTTLHWPGETTTIMHNASFDERNIVALNYGMKVEVLCWYNLDLNEPMVGFF